MKILRDYKIGVCCLVERWHDTDSIAIDWWHISCFQVVDQPRPRIFDDMSNNHGGIAVIASASVGVRRIVITDQSSFELIGVRISLGQCRYVVVVLYRPGSTPVWQEFFDDLSAVLDVIATYRILTYLVY
jgi:hypothetical protein